MSVKVSKKKLVTDTDSNCTRASVIEPGSELKRGETRTEKCSGNSAEEVIAIRDLQPGERVIEKELALGSDSERSESLEPTDASKEDGSTKEKSLKDWYRGRLMHFYSALQESSSPALSDELEEIEKDLKRKYSKKPDAEITPKTSSDEKCSSVDGLFTEEIILSGLKTKVTIH
jgi:hypothetical protein